MLRSSSARLTGLRPMVSKALSPRPIPQVIRPLDISCSVDIELATRVGCRVVAFVTASPRPMRLVCTAAAAISVYASRQIRWLSPNQTRCTPKSSAVRTKSKQSEADMIGCSSRENFSSELGSIKYLTQLDAEFNAQLDAGQDYSR